MACRFGADLHSLYSNFSSIKKTITVSLVLQATFVLRIQACDYGLTPTFQVIAGCVRGLMQWAIFSDLHPENRSRDLNYNTRLVHWF